MPYKLNIGDGEHYLKWDGETLFIKGMISLDALSILNANIGVITAGEIHGVRFYVGKDTDKDIYFEDSGIRMYDAVDSLKKQIYWKYGTINFARLTYDTAATKETNLHLYAGAYNVFMGLKDTGIVGFITNGNKIILGDGNALSSLMFWTGTKQLYLGVSVDAPAENNYAGQIVMKEGGAADNFHWRAASTWRKGASNLGW